MTWGSGPLLRMACTSPVRYLAPPNLASMRWYCLFVATIRDFVHQIHSVVAEIWYPILLYVCFQHYHFCMVLSKYSYKQEYPSSIQGLCHQTKAFISQQPLNGFWWTNSRIVAINWRYHLVLARFCSAKYLMGLVNAMQSNGPLL